MNSGHGSNSERIDHDDYQVSYDAAVPSIMCAGTFRLRGDEYAEMSRIFGLAADGEPPSLTLDLTAVEFLNSSGINTISKFVLKLRRQGTTQLVIRGNEQVAWQRKSLRNLERLLPGATLELR